MRLFIICFAFLPFWINAQTPITDNHWQLLWEDEFNTFDANRWEKKDQFDQYGQQVQVFIEENANVNAGVLELELKQETFSCEQWAQDPLYFCVGQYYSGQPYQYTSGFIQTKSTEKTQYGYIEARIKLSSSGEGLWPAFWTYAGPPGKDKNDTEEIDIFEILPGRIESNKLRHSCDPDCDNSWFKPKSCSDCHWLTVPHQMKHDKNWITSNIHRRHGESLFGKPPFEIHQINDYTQWHKYAIEWSPSKIIFYVDDKVVRVSKNNGLYDINMEHSIKLSLSMDPNNSSSFSHLPAKMFVDYVKVYKLNEDCFNNTVLGPSYNYSNYMNSVKNTISINNNSLTVGENISLRASNWIHVSGNFLVPVGSDFFMDVNQCP